MGGELVGWKNMLVLMPYGDRFRNYRRLSHSVFGSRNKMAGFERLEEIEMHRFLKRLLPNPDGVQDYIRKYVGFRLFDYCWCLNHVSHAEPSAQLFCVYLMDMKSKRVLIHL